MANANPYVAQVALSKDLTDIMSTITRVEASYTVFKSTFIGFTSLIRGVAISGDELYFVQDIISAPGINRIRVFDTKTFTQNRTFTLPEGEGVHYVSITVFGNEVYVTRLTAPFKRIEVYGTSGGLNRSWVLSVGDRRPAALASFNNELFVTYSNVVALENGVEVYNSSGTLQREWAYTTGDGIGNLLGGTTVSIDEVRSRLHAVLVRPLTDQQFVVTTDLDGANEVFFQSAGFGTGNGEFKAMSGVAYYNDRLYVTDAGQLGDSNDRVQIFTHIGAFVTIFRTPLPNFPPGGFSSPSGIIVDATAGFIFVGVIRGINAHKLSGIPTTWHKYGSLGTSAELDQVYTSTVGPADNALTVPIPQDRLQIGERFDPTNIRLVRDIRERLEALAASGTIANKVTGNAVTWASSGADDLYYTATLLKLSAYGRLGGVAWQWTRTLGEMSGTPILDADVAELKLCADFLEDCLIE